MQESLDGDAHLLLAAGVTHTGSIPGISAAGADSEAVRWTPTADAEILAAGQPMVAPEFPRSPTGCPTPAVVTRAICDHLDVDVTIVDAGLAETPEVETVAVGATPGGDVRDAAPVPEASTVFDRAREVAASIDADRLLLAETIPGGTTTAMGVLAALGERTAVSSSLPENPVEQKQSVVEGGLDASDLEPGDLAGHPREAVRQMGDPALATLAGAALGADADTGITLAGGTQLACVGALLRHAGVDRSLELATTSYVADDESADIQALAEDLDLTLRTTDPGFEDADDQGLIRFAAGEAKEGVGMGGALALADERGVSMVTVREQAAAVHDHCLAEAP